MENSAEQLEAAKGSDANFSLSALAKGTDSFAAVLHSIGQADVETVFKALRTSAKGLTYEHANWRLKKYGLNEVAHEKPLAWHSQLYRALKNPLILLLVGLSVLSFATDDKPGGTIIGMMVGISVILTFFQEYRSSRAAESLKAMVTNTATTLRSREMFYRTDLAPVVLVAAEKVELPIKQLVPGDVIQLSAGDMIPADLRLLSCKDLFVSQSALTGEAFPVEKFPNPPANSIASPLEMPTLCFMASNVVSGTASAVVVGTGDRTYLGSLAQSVAGQRSLTSFENGINRFTVLMLRFMLVMVPLVFLINGLSKHNWMDAFMFSLAVAVGLTPEMLPMIVTVNLAKGALSMSRQKVIVKRLNSIQNFGAMDVLCTDKTGTLTQNQVVLLKHVDAAGEKSQRVLKYAYLNSFYQTGLKNLLDVAVLTQGALEGAAKLTAYRKIDEIPFDFMRRRMSVVVEEEGMKHVLICKGALEEISSVCDRVEIGDEIKTVNEALKGDFLKMTQEFNEDGLRVIAVAYKIIPQGQADYGVKDESGMILLGYLAFLDPPKETTREAVMLLKGHGVDVKVLTGDSDIVTRKICSQVGIDAGTILLGGQIEEMSDGDLAEAVELHKVFAKLSPAQKERIVKAMHTKGHVVGFMGDGINDAAALRAADVGISVDNAVDIAKESADIILLEKSLLVLERGVVEGRLVFGNIVKYIKMGASSNFGNTFSVLGASLFLPFLPMLPVQLLIQNLLYDLSQTAIPLDRVDEEYLAQPRRWEIGDIAKFMVYIGPISSIFDYTTFALMWFVFGANSPDKQSLFQSGWFVEGLLSQTLIVHMIRTNKIPFVQSTASMPLVMTTLGIMAVGIVIPFTPLAAKLNMVALPGAYFGWLLATLFCYTVLTQIVKSWFVRKYGIR